MSVFVVYCFAFFILIIAFFHHEKGADPNWLNPSTATTGLHIACKLGHTKIALLLLQRGGGNRPFCLRALLPSSKERKEKPNLNCLLQTKEKRNQILFVCFASFKQKKIEIKS